MTRRRRRREPRVEQPETPPVPAVKQPDIVLTSDILDDPKRLASDAKMVRGLLKFGCIPQEKVDALLHRLFDAGLTTDSARDLKGLGTLLKDLGKLQLDIDKLNKPVRHEHAHLHAHGTVDAERSRMVEIAARAGVPNLYQ
jgi:hypothetical protein